MSENIKKILGYIEGLCILVLGFLFFNQKKKNEQIEGELSKMITENKVQEVDHEREITKQHADNLVNEYERLKGRYDGNDR